MLSEESETGCRSLYKPSFIRKRGTTYLPQDLLMNEPLSFPLSLVWCVYMCVLRESHYFEFLDIVSRFHICEVIVNIELDVLDMSPCNNSFSVSLLVVYVSHIHTYKHSSPCQTNNLGQPWYAEVFTLNCGNEIPSHRLMFSNTFH